MVVNNQRRTITLPMTVAPWSWAVRDENQEEILLKGDSRGAIMCPCSFASGVKFMAAIPFSPGWGSRIDFNFEVVGQGPSQLSQGLHFLGLAQLRFQPRFIGD